jgi:hypothetical protein
LRFSLAAIALAAVAGAALAQAPASALNSSDEDYRSSLRAAIEKIGASETDVAGDALIDLWVTPLAEELNRIESGPREARIRVARAMQRGLCALRFQLAKAKFDEADRARLDRIYVRERRLVEELFHDDDRVRMAALERIPLEPDTPAGLLLAAKLFDDNAEVMDRALARATELHDASVLRGVRRLCDEVLIELQTPPADSDEVVAAIVLGTFLERGAMILATHGDAQDAALVTRVLDRIGGRAFRPYLQHLPEILDGMGRIGDEACVPTLMTFLDDGTVRLLPRLGEDKPVMRTAGDAALLAVIRIYGLKPAAFGFVSSKADAVEQGFLNAEDRSRAHLAFRKWYEENANKPKDQRAAFTPIAPEKTPEGGAR